MTYDKEYLSKNVWREKGYHIDALILTTFSPFDKGTLKMLENGLAAAADDTGILSRVFLIGCNPHYRKALLNDSPLGRRIFCPDCKITCKECVGSAGSKPQKYYHPKIWCIRFKSESDVIWRIVVSSRNLASVSQRLLDGFFVTQAKISATKQDRNNPLVELLERIRNADKQYKSLIDEISRLDYNEEFTFYPNDKLLDALKDADELYVLSPFANGAFINMVNAKSIKVYGPKNEMKCLYSECENNGRVVEIISRITSSDDNDSIAKSLHAKQYITKKGDRYYLYIGSHNATANALTNNTEFSVELCIDAKEAEEILGYWRKLYPDKVENGQQRQQQEPSEHFLQAFDDSENFSNDISEAEEKSYWHKTSEEIFEKACAELCSKMFGKSDNKDFDLLLRTCDLVSDADIDKAIIEVQEDFPGVLRNKSWEKYTDSCIKALRIIKEK